MIYINPNVQKPYSLGAKEIGEYLKELKETKKEIEKSDWTFEKTGLCNSEYKKKVLDEINNQIKLCEHYFKTKKRKDLFQWAFIEKYKYNDWGKERERYTFSNGLLRAVIDVYKNINSTKIEYGIESDCDLYLYFRGDKGYKNLRSENSINEFIQEIKKYLESEIDKVEYDRKEHNFLEFVLKPIKRQQEVKN